MNRTLLREISALLLFLIAATGVIAWSNADLSISAAYYQGGGWPVGVLAPWQMLYKLNRTPAITLAAFGLAGFIISFFRRDRLRWRRGGGFLVLLLLLGPGLIVNTMFKDHWGRPRPRDIAPFGGKQQFLQPWQKGEDGKGRSFPSGHASGAFFISAPYFIYRRSDRRAAYAWLAAGLIFGAVMGFARIAQGAHFLSDILWAWGMVHLTALILARIMGLDHVGHNSAACKPESCST